ncbi:MAG TPA: acetyl-CoA C-acyltransferase [Pseudolabrys sp.]|nr:acetyl-CoA C-acyltransferase [Pseudolabrys sp.]
MTERAIWLASGVRTPFLNVDGGFANRDAVALSAPVAQAMAARVKGKIDLVVWGWVVQNLNYANLAREIWFDAKLDPHVPSFTTVMQCSTGMVGVFEAAGMLGQRGQLAIAGGVESMSGAQIALSQKLSVWLRRVVQARNFSKRMSAIGQLQLKDVRLYIPEIKNRVTGKSMGEHTEDMAKAWDITRREQDELALQSHQRAVAAQDRGFFDDLIVPVDGVTKDHFPRRDTSLEKLGALKPAFDRKSGKGTITAGNSSPLTDGAAAIWIATEEGLSRLPPETPRARLVDFELAAVDVFKEGFLMAPVSAIPRMLARNGLTYGDIALWEIHEAFSAQVACHLKALDDKAFVREKAGVEHTFGAFPRERMNPNGGSVALGHPFAATGARILSQAIKELATMAKGSRAIVSICADGGLGSVALLQS